MKKCACGNEMTPVEWKHQWVCYRCGRTKPIKMVTNADRIRGMDDEDLAKRNVILVRTRKMTLTYELIYRCSDGYETDDYEVAIAHELEWLRQPVEETDHE